MKHEKNKKFYISIGRWSHQTKLQRTVEHSDFHTSFRGLLKGIWHNV